ncbi:MAG: hypothetical protein HQM09_06905 [Candidatus Riflebacteria bacterium]|nr:hypothetical protein [Candidatus Riflebacteria bacterium]
MTSIVSVARASIAPGPVNVHVATSALERGDTLTDVCGSVRQIIEYVAIVIGIDLEAFSTGFRFLIPGKKFRGGT